MQAMPLSTIGAFSPLCSSEIQARQQRHQLNCMTDRMQQSRQHKLRSCHPWQEVLHITHKVVEGRHIYANCATKALPNPAAPTASSGHAQRMTLACILAQVLK